MPKAKRERRERTDNYHLIQQRCRTPEQYYSPRLGCEAGNTAFDIGAFGPRLMASAPLGPR